jgi:MoaA/NifB/PqqE/SkfB family radical SAM enzyme
MNNTDEWVAINDAARILGVTYFKLSQLVTSGQIETKENIRDKRKKLINMRQAREILGIR